VFSPGGKVLAAASADHTISLWQASSGKPLLRLRGHQHAVNSLAFSPDGQMLFSASHDSIIRTWTAPRTSLSTGIGSSVLESRTASQAADSVSEPQQAKPRDRARILALQGYANDLREAWNAWRAGDMKNATEYLARHEPQGGQHEDLRGFEWYLLAAICQPDGRTQPGRHPPALSAEISRDDRFIASSDSGGTMLVGSIRSVASPCLDVVQEGRAIHVNAKTGKMWLMSFPAHQTLGELPTRPHKIRDAIFFPRGDQVAAVGIEPSLLVYDAATRRLRRTLDPQGKRIQSVAVSPDGKCLAGNGFDGTVWLWDLDSGALTATLSTHQVATVRSAFSPDGRILATGSSNEHRVVLWSLTQGEMLTGLDVGQDVMGMSFSPDGTRLAVAGYDGAAMLWDVESRERLAVLYGHAGALRGVAFSPDSRTLATVGDDGTVRLWHVATHQEIVTLARHSLSVRWVKFLSPRRFVAGTLPYESGRRNDVLFFDAGEPDSSGVQQATGR
jgi:WD40 repeat protein